MDVLLVAAKKETVNDYVNVAREAGLEPMVMDVQACDLQNMFEVNYGGAGNETIVLIDVGAAVTNINVLTDGVTTFTRDIAMAGNLITEEIQKQLNITYEEAETYKRGGAGGSDTVVPQDDVVQQVAEAIAGEVQRSLDLRGYERRLALLGLPERWERACRARPHDLAHVRRPGRAREPLREHRLRREDVHARVP